MAKKSKVEVFNGYVEARKMDIEIDKLTEKYPLSASNAREWAKFARTVRTGLEILEEEAIRRLLELDST